MRLSLSALYLCVCALTLAAAWSKEDQEIFRLRDEVAASEGPEITFYDFLGITPSASQDDIGKAYKKLSRTLHPDKVKQQFIASRSTSKSSSSKSGKKKPGVHVSKGPSQGEIKAAVKAASDRFARLGLVTAILRGPGRERYDHFLYNGFPTWKGTGYYYARFRPGLGTVLVGLFIFVGGAGHYLALYMSWKRQQEFVTRYIRFARNAAWGDSLGIPGVEGTGTATPPVVAGGDGEQEVQQPMNRRQRRMQEKDARREKPDKKSKKKISPAATPPAGASGAKKRVVAENGKILVVDSVGNVFLEQKDEEGETQEFLLDPSELQAPTFKDTALYRLPLWIYARSIGQFLNKKQAEDDDGEDDIVEAEAEDESQGSSTPEDFEVLDTEKSTAQNGTGKAVKRNKKNKGSR